MPLDDETLVARMTSDGASVCQALDRWAVESPAKCCIHYGESNAVLTYAEMAELTNDVAMTLARIGLLPGDRVSVFSKSPIVCSVWMFGIWKAAAVYCPVNPDFTGGLLRHQLNDTAPELIVVDEDLVSVIDEIKSERTSTAMLCVVAENGSYEVLGTTKNSPKASSVVDRTNFSASAPAAIFFTSGTTGPSKGAVLSHSWMAQYTYLFRLLTAPDDVIYIDTPMFHVTAAIANFARAVWRGASITLWNRFSPSKFLDRVRTSGASWVILMDVMTIWLMSQPELPDDATSSLRFVCMAPLPMNHLLFARRFGVDFVVTGLGQTESGLSLAAVIEESSEETNPTRGLSHQQIRSICVREQLAYVRGEDISSKGFLGQPTPWFELAVLDHEDNSLSESAVGQLAVRPRLPDIIFREYVNQPEATVASMRNAWFHTGDAVERRSDGYYYFSDRLSGRIRVRGENLSSFQVEEMLGNHPYVAICAVFGVPSSQGDEDDVVAYLQPVPGNTLDLTELADWCAVVMPKYMRPKYFRVLEQLPRTGSNKIEKYKLRELYASDVSEKNDAS